MQFLHLNVLKNTPKMYLQELKIRKSVRQVCSKLIEFCFLFKILSLIYAKIPQEISLRDEVNQGLCNFTIKIKKQQQHKKFIIQSYN